ncbi:hypothetical protein ILUMI_10053 [Ignelater luminosus]|uniref:Uncharacterized protein n=1 Tax=Ignelater luminosus TaxID=2038154 RepID=A0A8K0CYL0_IGNLU|nr:hypothetical protein ILUMI_10053 [Ignelater luminosus]
MKFSIFVCVVFMFWESILLIEARPSDVTISKDMPDTLLETVGQAINCSHYVSPGSTAPAETTLEGVFPEDNDSFNAFFGCIWKKKGIINDAAEINEENLRIYLKDLFTMGEEISERQKSLIDEVVAHCKDLVHFDYKKKSIKMNNCIMNYLHSLIKQ